MFIAMSRLPFAFFRRRRPPQPMACLPGGLRVYAVGDIHGRLDCLLMLETAIRRDVQARGEVEQAIVIFLGDYIDRGPDSNAVIKVLAKGRFASLPARFLMGNHEDTMLKFLEDSAIGSAWLNYGGTATLASYGVKPIGQESDGRMEQLRKGLIEVLPRDHLTFLQSLELAIELGGYLFVHAGVRPGRALSDQRREDLLTIREPFFAARQLPWKVVHGHTVFDQPVIGLYRVSLDTGAYASGVLTCAVIEGDQVEILDL
jgi:serine/threonine protein phosphatase 1